MPLRFRAVVPYTLPGVLALIGCWWYLSRKKQQSINHENPEVVSPTSTGLKTSLAEGRNGLLESTVSPTHTPSKVVNQRAEDGNVSQNFKAALSAEQSSEDVPAERRVEILSKEDNLQANDHKDLEHRSSTGFGPDVKDAHTAEEDLVVCQSAHVRCSSPTTAQLSGSERPEPVGEVALLTEDKMVACVVTPPKTEKEVPSMGDPLETTPSAQEFNQHLLTSTPTFAVTTAVQEPTIRPPSADDQVQACSEEEQQNLELLASGLITEVISAATQEVLGVSSCLVPDGGHPNYSNTPLGAGQPCSQQKPVAAKQHHRPLNVTQNGCEEMEVSGMPNGCSPVHQGVHQTNGVQTDQWLASPHQAAQMPEGKLAAEETSVPAEDSACSTCHSEDGVSSEDLQNSTNQTETIQVTGCSATESTGAAPSSEENAVDEIKRLNGLSLRNGGVGNEAETDQSGGETAATVTSCQKCGDGDVMSSLCVQVQT